MNEDDEDAFQELWGWIVNNMYWQKYCEKAIKDRKNIVILMLIFVVKIFICILFKQKEKQILNERTKIQINLSDKNHW